MLVNAEQAAIALEDAGAVAVIALLRKVPADIRWAAGGVARMADPTIVEEVV